VYDEEVVDLPLLVARLRRDNTDSPSVEVKSAAGGMPSDLEKTICAFANLPGGGVIVLGLDERSGFLPVQLSRPNDLKSGLASIARTAVVPPVMIDIRDEEFEGRTLIVGVVNEIPGLSKPCRLKRDGSAYMRFWDGDYRLSELEIEGFIASRTAPRFDVDVVPGAVKGDLDDDLVSAFIASARSSERRFSRYNDSELLRRLGVLTNESAVTTAGLLALGDYPQQFFPNFCVQAAAAPEPGAPANVRVGDTARFDGPIGHIIDGVVEWTRKHSRHRIVDHPDGRVMDQYDFPAIAVRELVANSLVHRDLAPWSWSRAIELRIDAKQFRLVNPGGLYGVPFERFGQQPLSSARNAQLLRICQYTSTVDGRIVEALATGIPRVFAETDGQGLPRPTFFDQALAFTAILHRPESVAVNRPEGKADRPMSAALRDVILVLSEGPRSLEQVAQSLELSPEATRARLSRLRANGLIEVDGVRGSHNTTYRLPQRARTGPGMSNYLGDLRIE
jgi:ATP-dependent DNA helicase RecG